MRKICGIVLSLVMLVGIGLSVANAQTETRESTQEVYRLADTPTRYGFKGLYTLFSPDTAQKGKFGIGVFWEMTRFCLPGDPRYPELQEYILAGYYGITDKLEVGLAAPFRSLKIPAASSTNRYPTDPALDDISESGFSNVSLGLRYQLVGEKDVGFKLSPYILAFLPTAQDPELGTGADNTRIHFGVSAGAVLEDLANTRVYGQVAYQFATDYDQDREDFTERGWWAPTNPLSPPRFDYFGTNPLFHEYGNTLFYGAGFAVPVIPDTVELFSEFQLYHSFDDPDYIPLFEDYNEAGNYEELDVVQDGGAVHVGAQVGFGNGLALIGGWGAKLFAEEPMYESPIWRVFAGLSYNSPREEVVTVEIVTPPPVKEVEEVGEAGPRKEERLGPAETDCEKELAKIGNILFEFDKSTLTAEGIEQLKMIGKVLRVFRDCYVEVQGHTDWVGTENYNMGLGNRRARAVVYYLVYDEGIEPERVVLKEKMAKTPPVIAGETYGETQPIASNETDAGRAQNRRAQLVTR